jgi:hypothetical protein
VILDSFSPSSLGFRLIIQIDSLVHSICRSYKLGPSRVTAMSSSSSSDPSMETVAPHAAVTSERRLNPDLQEQLPKPCTYHFPPSSACAVRWSKVSLPSCRYISRSSSGSLPTYRGSERYRGYDRKRHRRSIVSSATAISLVSLNLDLKAFNIFVSRSNRSVARTMHCLRPRS